jgi:hypothetical protein
VVKRFQRWHSQVTEEKLPVTFTVTYVLGGLSSPAAVV